MYLVCFNCAIDRSGNETYECMGFLIFVPPFLLRGLWYWMRFFCC